MKIAVGTTNQVKIDAVKEVLQTYPSLAHCSLHPCAVSSEIADQPLSLTETIRGAKNRARNAFQSCSPAYAFGIESGLFEAPGTQTGYLESCICCIFDGTHYFTGLSCGFEVPPHILKLVIERKLDLSQACYEAQVTSNPSLGAAEGLVGLLTKGRVNRKEYTKQAIMTALVQIEHNSWYQPTSAKPSCQPA